MLRFSLHTRLTTPGRAYRYLCLTLQLTSHRAEKTLLLSTQDPDNEPSADAAISAQQAVDSLMGYIMGNVSKATLCRYSARVAVA